MLESLLFVMAEILPFRALQYFRDKVPIEKVVTQPYDKISSDMQDRYRASHPNNLVRVLRPASEPEQEEGRSPYERAASILRQWRRDGVLEKVSEPSLFAYFERFTVPGTDETRTRKGFVGLCRLEDYENGVIYPHERTLRGPKADRLELLRHTRTHFGQVFMMYSDPHGGIDAVLDRVAERLPEISIRDEYDVDHMMWTISDSTTIGAIRRQMADRKLVIADGHHRYETALAFRDEMRVAAGSDDAGTAEWLMTTLVNMDSPGMTVLGTHRVIRNLPSFDIDSFLARARDYFEVSRADDLEAVEKKLAEAGARPTIGLRTEGQKGFRVLALRDGLEFSAILPGVSPLEIGLDVVILHWLVLDKCLDISEEDVRGENYLGYVRGAAAAVEEVSAGRAKACFLLNPTRLEQVRDIAFAGEVLPQKSTDFFPKVLSGLTMYSME